VSLYTIQRNIGFYCKPFQRGISVGIVFSFYFIV